MCSVFIGFLAILAYRYINMSSVSLFKFNSELEELSQTFDEFKLQFYDILELTQLTELFPLCARVRVCVCSVFLF